MHIEKTFPSVALYMVFVGKSHSGKSSLITFPLMKRRVYRNTFQNVLICIPKHSLNSMSGKDNPFLALILDSEKVYHEFDYKILEHIYQQIVEYATEDEDTLLLIVDFESQLKNGDLVKLLNSLVNNRHHLQLSIWMSVQTYIYTNPYRYRIARQSMSLYYSNA